MNGKFKIITLIGSIFGLIGAAWATNGYLNKQYVPREVYEIQLAGIGSQIIKMQKNNLAQYWINQKTIWDNEVKKYQELCIRNPQDQRLKYKLQNAIRERDKADAQLMKLQNE